MTLTQALLTRPLFQMRLAVDALVSVGGPEGLERRIGNIDGGSFEGERLSGIVMPGGSDWQILRSDGVVQLDARILLRTGGGARIAMTYEGVRHGSREVLEQLARGEAVDPASYYFRIVARFATSDASLLWLNRTIALATGERLPAGPLYSVHELL